MLRCPEFSLEWRTARLPLQINSPLVGPSIGLLRQFRGVGLDELAQRLGYELDAWNEVERGALILPAGDLERAATALEASVSYILFLGEFYSGQLTCADENPNSARSVDFELNG
jgi:transcriptional regulator with XRE-family HTH domain